MHKLGPNANDTESSDSQRVVYLDFKPALTGTQYTRLLQIAKETETADELRIMVREWAEQERLVVGFEE